MIIFVRSENGEIQNVSGSMIAEVDRLLYNLKLHMPQFEMDGYKNIWIVKPGAKSRGRGAQIILYVNVISDEIIVMFVIN